jgi:general secretion pathway protein E
MILERSSDVEIERAARASGMSTMYESGIAKVWRGETTIEEVLQVTRMVG